MSGIWGNNIQLSIFGESHGPYVGITIHGLPSGIYLDTEEIQREMRRRAPGNDALSTARKEADIPEIISGVFQGRTTGAPLSCLIPNKNYHSEDYESSPFLPRPGHSDYPAAVRYSGFQDFRGGGHFSGRMTAPLVFAGAICYSILQQRGITIGAHIQRIGTAVDDSFSDGTPNADGILKGVPADQEAEVLLDSRRLKDLRQLTFPLLNREREKDMKACIQSARAEGDSVGGVIECAATGLPTGLGAPFFDSVESVLSHLLFSVPAVKGVEFGDGFAMSSRLGSECKDEYFYDPHGQIGTKMNHNGGILGGLTTGMPLVFRAAIKPTPSIAKQQHTVDLSRECNTVVSITGRHDPCIVPRAVPVIEAVCAIGLCQFFTL